MSLDEQTERAGERSLEPARLRTVTLCTGLAQGGISHYGYALAEALQAEGIATTALMYSHPDYELADYPHTHRVNRKLVLGGARSRHSLYTGPFRNLFELVRASRTSDIVHFQWSLGRRSDRLHWPVLRRLGKRIVYTAHDVLPHEPEIMSEEHCRWIYQSADALIVHGAELKQLLLDRFQVAPSTVTVIPHGNYNFVADTSGPWNRASARASMGWTEDDRVVLFFGLIRAYKGLDVLIEACRLIKERGLRPGQRLRLLVAGRAFRNHWAEGNYEELIRRANLSGEVSLHLEHIDMKDVPRFFHAADVVAVPYRRGSQSGVLHLAYAFGKATVATRVGSLASGATSGAAQFVDPENPPAMADALRELLLDPDASERLGRKGRLYSDTDISWKNIAHQTRALYESLL